MHPNMKALLDTLGFSEGTSTSRATKNNGYDVIVTGIDGKPEIFTDYSTHPFANGRAPKVINSKGLKSSASGRYQHLVRDWEHYRRLLKLPDFGPASQDAWAIQLIKERGAVALIEAGRFAEAITKISNIWASLPGANYANQPMHPMAKLQAYYLSVGGKLA